MAGAIITTLFEFFDKTKLIYKVPIYQRKYTWRDSDCIKFLKDIYKWFLHINSVESSSESTNFYFAGSIVTYQDGNIHTIVDGQQRLTTTILILSALKFVMKEDDLNVEAIDDLIFKQSVSMDSIKERKIKLNNPKTDHILSEISKGLKVSEEESLLYKNYLALKNAIKEIKSNDSNYSKNILSSLKHVVINHVHLTKYDNPTEIFETINTTGKALTPADMIKNYIFFYSVKYSEHENELCNLYEKIEDLIWVTKKKKERDQEKMDIDLMTFYRYISNILTGGNKLVKKESLEIFNQFKEAFDGHDFENHEGVKKILNELHKHALVWNKIHNFEPHKNIDQFYYDSFKESIYTYYSLVHQLVYDKLSINNGNFKLPDDKEMCSIFKTISKLVFSLLISGKPEKNITRDIPTIFKSFKESNESDFEIWMTKTRKDQDIKILDKEGLEKYIGYTNVYNISNKKTKMLLFGIEGMLDNWEINTKNYDDINVEHIIPQNYHENSDYFKNALIMNNNNKKDAEIYLEKIKHTLPNLTIVACPTNSELSNKPYKEKFDIYNKKSILSINKKIIEYSEWNENSLRDRSNWMVEKIYNLLLA